LAPSPSAEIERSNDVGVEANDLAEPHTLLPVAVTLPAQSVTYLDEARHSLTVVREGAVPLSPLPGGRTVTLVVPAMNEAANIPWVFERIPSCVSEVVLVDGYSTDDTVGAALRARPDTRIVRQHARGKGSALRCGFTAATGDYVVMIDADGSMDPLEIDTFLHALDNGYDFVKGSRYLPGGGSEDLTKLRNIGNFALKASVNMLFLVPFTDLCYGYVAFRRACLDQLCLTSHGFEIEAEMAIHAVKAELRIAEVPSNELCRRNGLSNLNTFRDGKRVLRTVVRERVSRRRRPVVDWLDVSTKSNIASPVLSSHELLTTPDAVLPPPTTA
jgi:glycosyltransferase involved in cell wall biosynthesis